MRQKESHRYEFGPFVVDADDRLLLRDGAAVALTPKVFDLLLILVENSGHVLEKDELVRRIWPDSFVEEGNLNRNISTLRKVLGESPDECRFIETLPKRGYRFIAPVKEIRNGTWERNHQAQDNTALPAAGKKAMLESDSRAGTTDRPVLAAAVAGAEGVKKSEPRALGSGPSDESPLAYARGSVFFLRFAGIRAFASFGARHWLVALLIISLAAAGIFLWLSGRLGGTAANARIRTIAVLPFKLVVGKGGDEYLGLGMADALITRLGNVRQVAVRPTSAVRKYGNAGQDAISAGSELRVDAVLDGSIQRINDRIRVTVQLFR
ncbi:MAG TPA: winged helix-turn-helix domain-containing protein, partial [Acidobacteriota bacterium]|nr:winged helix-turn-helix domain-containing protein [Acidobacteriota bacterium]